MKNYRSYIVAAFAAVTLAFVGCVPAHAQSLIPTNIIPTVGTPTNYIANPPTVASSVQSLIDAATSGVTNWYVGVYGLYAPKLAKRTGFGIGAAYPISTYVVASIRTDYINGGFWMPSGNATLQLPIKPFHTSSFAALTNFTVTPFTYAGVGIPLSGASGNNGQATGILGTGAVIDLWTSSTPSTKWYGIDSVKLVGDVEKWGGFDGNQYRLGIFINKKF